MIINGDALTVLKRMDSESVHMAVTSPPYYGLRKYNTPGIVWGGNINCPHEWGVVHPPGYRESDTNPGALQSDGNKNRENLTSDICSKCGSWKGELGLEPSPEMYILHLTEIFHELKRVLRSDGIFWCNIGDSYARNPAKGDRGEYLGLHKNQIDSGCHKASQHRGMEGYKEKDLIGIPWALAFSLRSDGWYLRSDVSWVKRNSMPSSVTDRPCSSMEHVFLFSKSKKYFYDHVATMQPSSESYNKDKRPRGKLRQTVNTNSKYPDEGQFKKQDGTGNPTTTGFNARYKASQEEWNGKAIACDANSMSRRLALNTKATREETGVHDGCFGQLRFMRDSDFFFKTWQGLLHNEDGEPMALVVNPRGYKGAHFACVDTETECLTIGGWKRYDQISEGTPIFTYNMKKSCLEIQPVKDIISYRYSGNLISVFGRSSNMLMTPDHRCVVTTRDKKINGGRHPAKIIEASKLKGGMKFIVSSHLDFDPVVPNDPKEYYELIGWVLSEGHFKDSGGIGISQSISKNPHKCERIQYLLEFLKVDFNTWSRKRPYKDVISEEIEWSISGEYRSKIRHMIPDKYRIPEHFVMLPDEYIESFLNGFIGGDGHTRPDGRICITQKEKQPLDVIQAMFLRMNTSCILSQKGNNMWSAFITNNKKDRCFKNSSSSLVKNDYAYDGTVWCPHVDNGTWVARRGGRPFITGNCFPVQLVEPLVLAGTSSHGVCPHCGSPWIRQTKKYYVGDTSEVRGDNHRSESSNNNHYLALPPNDAGNNTIQTTGWSPSCSCPNNIPIPAIVLDPFGGSSATGVACKLHNRNYIGIELNPEYCKLGEQRVRDGK